MPANSASVFSSPASSLSRPWKGLFIIQPGGFGYRNYYGFQIPFPSPRGGSWRGGIFTLAVILAFLAAAVSFAQTTPVPSVSPTPTASTPVPTVKASPVPEDSASGELKKLSLEQLMDLDVTSVDKQPEPYGEAPAAIDVITNDEINRSGASSIPEALRLADNLDVAQVSSAGWDISARGFNSSVSDKLLVLIDGRSVYTPLFAGVIWNLQDYLLEDIDRIEVISGPGGTLWGANAVNGVINITSKSAQDTQGLYLEAGGGTLLQDFTAARYGGLLASNIYYRVYGKYFDQGAEVYSDGTSAGDSWSKGQGGFRIDTDDSSEDKFTLQGDFSAGDSNAEPGGEGNPQAQGTSREGNVLGRWTRTFGEDSEMSLQTYYDYTHMGAPFQGAPAEPAFPPYFPASPAIPAGTLFEDLQTVDLDFQDRFPLDAGNHVIWGLGYRFTHDVIQDAPAVAFLPGTLDQNLYSGFVQDEINLFQDFSLTVGSKLEHNDYTGYEYEPSGRLQWNIADKQMLWAAVSRAVRTPSRYDRDLYQPGPDDVYIFHLVGNSDFESETVVAYELGYRAQMSREFAGSLSVFFNHYDNLRSEGNEIVDTSTSLINIFFQNNLEAQTCGFELTTDYQAADWWSWHLGYDFLHEDVWVRPGQTDLSNGLAETADPQNQVFLRSSMDFPAGFELNGDFRWIDTVHNGNIGSSTPGLVPSYAELDARLGWKAAPGLEISVVGQNLLHDQHVEAGYPGPAQEEISRSVYGKVACQF